MEQQSIGESGYNDLRRMIEQRLAQERRYGESVNQKLRSGDNSGRYKPREGEKWELEHVYFQLLLRTREGLEATVPENYHNRPLIATTIDENNCALHAMELSYNPHLSIDDARDMVTELRKTLETRGWVRPNEQIDVNDTTHNVPFGQIVLDVMSELKHIRGNPGLTVHYEYRQESSGKHQELTAEDYGDHEVLVAGDHQIHIYREDCKPIRHFWGMGAEIEPGAWKPEQVLSEEDMIKESIRLAAENAVKQRREAQEIPMAEKPKPSDNNDTESSVSEEELLRRAIELSIQQE